MQFFLSFHSKFLLLTDVRIADQIIKNKCLNNFFYYGTIISSDLWVIYENHVSGNSFFLKKKKRIRFQRRTIWAQILSNQLLFVWFIGRYRNKNGSLENVNGDRERKNEQHHKPTINNFVTLPKDILTNSPVSKIEKRRKFNGKPESNIYFSESVD